MNDEISSNKKEVVFFEDGGYHFLSLPEKEFFEPIQSNDIFSFFKQHDIRIAFIIEHDVKTRLAEYVMNKSLAGMADMLFPDSEIRKGNENIYVLYKPWLAIFTYEPPKIEQLNIKWEAKYGKLEYVHKGIRHH